MAEFESPKQQSPNKKKEKDENLSDSPQIPLEKETPSLKRKLQSSFDDEGASKKPKSAESKVTNDQVTAPPAANLSSKWTFEEENQLLDKVQEYLTNREDANEGKKPIYIKDIEWIKIDSGDHTTEEAQQRFLLISNRVRKMRTANEILKDMKEHNTKKKSREKKEITSDIPKKPLTPYFRYYMAKRHGVIERHPEMNLLDVTRKLGSKWKNLSEEKKKKYCDKYHEEMEDYTLQVMDYLKTHNPEVRPPKTKFELWAEEEKKKIRADRPDISEKKLAKKLRRRWENLEEEEKLKWEKKEKRELKRFRERISKSSQNKSKQHQKLGSSSEEK